ncbi:hypothetical protein A2U01_0061133, partial [Trifolium medium]|nr:hypothetical protein [Trifolium medium]
ANLNRFGNHQRLKKNPTNLNKFENSQRISIIEINHTRHQPHPAAPDQHHYTSLAPHNHNITSTPPTTTATTSSQHQQPTTTSTPPTTTTTPFDTTMEATPQTSRFAPKPPPQHQLPPNHN